MKNLLLLLAVVFASAVAFMNCGPANKCGPANCGGCCDASGTCVTATSATACGKLGETCNACTAPNNVCIAGACAMGMTGGGGGTTGGGGGTTGGGGGTTGGGGGTTGGGTGGGAACTAFDFSQGQSIYGEFTAATMNGDANHFGVVAAQSATASKVDFVFFEGWYFGANETPTFPKTVMLPSPAGASYWQCYDCLVLKEACDTNAQNCGRSYYVQGGSLNITTATMNETVGRFAAVGTNLNFVEWDLSNPMGGGDHAIAGGRCATVASVSLDATWDNTPDAGMDAGIDAGVDAGIDAGVDAGIDAGIEDAGVDAGIDDAGMDDAGMDDAGTDAGTDDAGIDAGP